MSPEVLKGDEQSYAVDVWALGILLFELFHDTTPFTGQSPREMLNNILEKKPKIAGMVPKDAKDLIQKLLAVDPSKRVTLEEVKHHPFILRYPCDFTAESDSKVEAANEKDEKAAQGKDAVIKAQEEEVLTKKHDLKSKAEDKK